MDAITMSTENWQRIALVAERCVRSTLNSVEQRPVEAPAGCGARTRASIRMTGSLRGQLVVAATTEAVCATCPIPGPLDRDLAWDWVCELTNLVMGHLRTELDRHGIQVDLATPRPLRSTSPPSLLPSVGAHAYTIAQGGITVSLSFDGASSALLGQETAAARNSQPFLLF